MDLSPLRFLLVEDHDFQRRAMAAMLASLGAVHVAEARDGIAALSELETTQSPVDVVLCDLDMPGIDGLEFLRRVGSTNHSPAIIIVSALDTGVVSAGESMAHALGLRVLGALHKPVTTQRLLDLLTRFEPPASAMGIGASVHIDPEDVFAAIKQGQFRALFQPQVDIWTGRVVGAEALAQWHHPVHGKISAAHFIPALEALELIDELTWEIIEQAVEASKRWELPVSINLSAVSLRDTTFADRVHSAIQARHIAPERITFEVTESVAIKEYANSLENLARLRMRRFGLAIDDFGSGYSSLQQLTSMPFSELKIDQSFVTGAHSRGKQRAVLESSLELARKLKLKVVAEGVETEQDWRLLKELGCDAAQGYYFARPLAMEAFHEWASNWVPPVF